MKKTKRPYPISDKEIIDFFDNNLNSFFEEQGKLPEKIILKMEGSNLDSPSKLVVSSQLKENI